MLLLLSKLPVGSGRVSYCVDTVRMELDRLLQKMIQMLKKTFKKYGRNRSQDLMNH